MRPIEDRLDERALLQAVRAKVRSTAVGIALTHPGATSLRARPPSAPPRSLRRASVTPLLRPLPRAEAADVADALHRFARAGQLRAWSRQLAELAVEITGDAAPADLAVLRRMSERFAEASATLAART